MYILADDHVPSKTGRFCPRLFFDCSNFFGLRKLIYIS
ncbi:hypothetical protein I656_03769 [Geobacillus sp. WSUCF1]|nr:hypothetical protein I656_03769 [Geobacillus sp. WSUCF1]